MKQSKSMKLALFGLCLVCASLAQEEIQSTLTPNSASGDADRIFTIQPKPISYTTSKRAAVLTCEAKDALDIHIKCNSEYVPDILITKSGSTINGQLIFKVETEITKDAVFEILARFSCFCIAQLENGAKQVNSREGEFKIARLSKVFPQSPIEVSQKAMEDAIMICRPPEGSPEATISWQKNGEVIDDSEPKYLITSEGSLVIREVTSSDQGNYTCVAKNNFFTRLTQPAKLYVYTNGGWSLWGDWDECDTTCGNGHQRRWRVCDSPLPSGRDGRMCEGAASQKSPCTVQCSPVDGQWSSWGSWEACDPLTCQRVKRRGCNNPPPSGSGRTCAGSDFQAGNCTECKIIGDGPNKRILGNPDNENIILWVVLIAAVAVFAVILVITVMCLMKKKSRRNNSYEEGSTDMDNGSREGEKFDRASNGTSMQPDLTKNIPLRHQRTHMASRTDSVGTPSEKMPMINTNSRPLPQREYYMQISPNANCDHHDYMQIGSGRDSENDSGEDKLSHHSSSPESGICNSCDRQSLISGQIASGIDVEALAWGNTTHMGGRLTVADSGVSITIPEGAIGRNQYEEIFIAALREDKERPVLLEKQTLLSPVIMCGPQDTTFNKSLILSFDHCASLKLGQWKLSIYSSNSSYNEPPKWERLVTLNQEILHMPVFCQLDSNRCHVMVDQLASRYCLVGESMYGSKAVKQLKLAVFAQPFSSSMDSSIRVYVLPDTQDAFSNVVQQESKLGAKLMDKPKQISFQDGGHNLCLMIDSISNGWVSKLPAQYQEIPFRHVWNAPSNLHCSFAFERLSNQPNTQLSCKIQVYQKSVLSNRQQININGGNLECVAKILGQKDLSSTVTVNTQSSSGCSSVVMLDNRDQQTFKLPTAIKKRLAAHLDLPCNRGNDWRMLASALSSDRQINFFASKPSPTEAILDLWEARTSIEEAPVTELTNILRAMGRQDAAVILERELGNAWV